MDIEEIETLEDAIKALVVVKTEINVMRRVCYALIPIAAAACVSVYAKASSAEKEAAKANHHYEKTCDDISELKRIMNQITVIKVKSD